MLSGSVSLVHEYYAASIAHRNSHKCGGYPFAHGDALTKLCHALYVNRVLEIGTAIGYSAYCFTRGSTSTHVTTIDMNADHAPIAQHYWKEYGVDDRITCIIGHSHDVLPTLGGSFDIVFFDGFAPDPTEVNEFIRVLNDDGVLISTNLSWNDSSAEYMKKISSYGLFTTRHGDTALSSRSKKCVNTCSQLWSRYVGE